MEHSVGFTGSDAEQPGGLGHCEAQSRHLPVLSPYPCGERRQRFSKNSVLNGLQMRGHGGHQGGKKQWSRLRETTLLPLLSWLEGRLLEPFPEPHLSEPRAGVRHERAFAEHGAEVA